MSMLIVIQVVVVNAHNYDVPVMLLARLTAYSDEMYTDILVALVDMLRTGVIFPMFFLPLEVVCLEPASAL
jgi:hypothetical protein